MGDLLRERLSLRPLLRERERERDLERAGDLRLYMGLRDLDADLLLLFERLLD